MAARGWLKRLHRNLHPLVGRPGRSLRLLGRVPSLLRGSQYGSRYDDRGRLSAAEPTSPSPDEEPGGASPNPLKAFFDSRKAGRGIWKWNHYFDIYHRHFSGFVGREVHVLEIGIYSGGSLEMWRDYFGPRCRIYGVDIQEAAKSYENEHTRVFIGDQEDRGFWREFKEQVPVVDILIDDGGHTSEQQIVTLEEMLPHLSPGGVYLCEDVHREHKATAAFLYGLASNLNAKIRPGPGPEIRTTEFQAWISSVHLYPYVAVLEKARRPVRQLLAPKHGTEWRPIR